MSNLYSHLIEKLYFALEKEQSNDNDLFLLLYVMTIWVFKCAIIHENNVRIIIKKG